MVGHDHLGAVGDQQPGLDATFRQGVHFAEKLTDIQGHAVADDVGDMVVKHAGGKLVEGEPAELVDDGVSGVAAALKADDDIRLSRQHIGDFALALVAPVGAYDRSYHGTSSFDL